VPHALTFDEEAHAYKLDGRPIPSVTTILQAAGLIDYRFMNPSDREFYLTRGKYVHFATQLLDENDLDYGALDPDIRGYLDGYIKFKKDTGFVPEMIEFQSYNDTLWYSGTLDRVGMLNGNRVIVDFKSGTVAKWVAIQTIGGYAQMEGVGTVTAGYGLELKSDGTYNLSEPFTDFTGAARVMNAAIIISRFKNA